MPHPLVLKDIDKTIQIAQRNYKGKIETIDDVKIVSLENHVEEDGDFSEIFQLSPQGNITALPNFKLAQLNRTKLLPGMVKAWHLHLRQDVVWYVSPSESLFVGLWDIRKSSKTKGNKMRLTLGNGNSALLLVPKGIAHGSANRTSTSVNLFYGTTLHFEKKNPDEYRIHDDDASFWMPFRD